MGPATPVPRDGAPAPGPRPGEYIGPYKLLEVLGEGGFGVVYLAERHQPIVQRVALKVLKPGMDSRAVLARFEQERQALAVMDHPNVARVFDAGTVDDGPARGLPYFVMEYVRGEAITVFCDRQRLTVRERLELFVPVCEAVQHAHMKGIIHRDIKPGNLLVAVHDERPVPKVIDFGVAKAVSHTLTQHTVFTEHGQLIGTPEYMSPEQAEMGAVDVDTRTDVYSLGVVLYELLAGVLPFDPQTLRAKAFDEVRRIIREDDPPKPSTRLTTLDAGTGAEIARRRHEERLHLARELRRELDWIPLKAIRKERDRRYKSAEALADDIRRYLGGRPLEAAPESTTYQLRKFVRRHRPLVFGSAAVALALVAGLSATLWQAGLVRIEARNARAAEAAQRELAESESAARRESDLRRQQAEQARAAEEQQARRAETAREFMKRALVSSDPNQQGVQGVQVADAMIKELESGSLKDQKEIEAGLRLTIAEILNGNARSAEALPMAQRALEINRALHDGDDPDVAASMTTVAFCLDTLGRSGEALPMFESALAMQRRLHPGDHPDIAATLNNTGLCLALLGRLDEALERHEAALEMRRHLFPGDDAAIAQSLNNIGLCLRSLGRAPDALPKFTAALEMYQRLYPGDHPHVALGLNNTATCLVSLSRFGEALPRAEAASAMCARVFKGDHDYTASSLNNAAVCLTVLGRPAEALPKAQAALDMRRRLSTSDHADLANTLGTLGLCLQALGRAAEALPYHLQAIEMRERLFKDADNAEVASGLDNAGLCLQDLHRAQEALPRNQAALEMRRRIFKTDHAAIAQSLMSTGTCLQSLGRATEALPMFESALEMRRRILEPANTGFQVSLARLAALRDDMHDPAAAEPLWRELLTIREKSPAPGAWRTASARSRLGGSIMEQSRYAEAEPFIVQGFEALLAAKDTPRSPVDNLKDAAVRAVSLYERWYAAEPGSGHDAQAAAWRQRLDSLPPAPTPAPPK